MFKSKPKLRDASELEGSLFPPPPESVAVAVPVMADNEIPYAPTLNAYEDDSPDAQARAVTENVKVGSAIGKVQNKIDRGKMMEGKRRIFVEQKAATHIVKDAQRNALRRKKEGFPAQEMVYEESKGIQEKDERIRDLDNEKYNSTEGGYQVSGYDVNDYKGMAYDGGYKYKSVYDK